MAGVLGVSGRFGQIVSCKLRGPLVASCRPASYWNKDWAPKGRPMTEEERRAAAKKYNMLPEDYQTRDDSEGLTWGDSPKLPTVPAAARDPNEDYDFPTLRRNYGEPVDIYMDAYTMERLDNSRQRTPPMKQAAMFLGTVLSLWFLTTLFNHPKLRCGFNPDLGPPQMPNDGVVHYTFDPPQ
uniref:Putative ubiquinone oxidoreductase ndufb8/ashi subunit n=1 Tax=Amblyomma aureolatum TaxID=187763 RepID=A0A1E1WYV0_9ACAR